MSRVPSDVVRARAATNDRQREDGSRMPRLVGEKEAAEDVVGVELSVFRAWVAAGRLPKPMPDCGKYDRKALDAALDKLSGLGGPSNALDAWRVRNRSKG
jgi:hypothetical protein